MYYLYCYCILVTVLDGARYVFSYVYVYRLDMLNVANWNHKTLLFRPTVEIFFTFYNSCMYVYMYVCSVYTVYGAASSSYRYSFPAWDRSLPRQHTALSHSGRLLGRPPPHDAYALQCVMQWTIRPE